MRAPAFLQRGISEKDVGDEMSEMLDILFCNQTLYSSSSMFLSNVSKVRNKYITLISKKYLEKVGMLYIRIIVLEKRGEENGRPLHPEKMPA